MRLANAITGHVTELMMVNQLLLWIRRGKQYGNSFHNNRIVIYVPPDESKIHLRSKTFHMPFQGKDQFNKSSKV